MLRQLGRLIGPVSRSLSTGTVNPFVYVTSDHHVEEPNLLQTIFSMAPLVLPKAFQNTVRATEESVGITGWVSMSPEWTGVVKERFADFQVHEVARDGTVAEVLNFDVPVDNSPDQATPEQIVDSAPLISIVGPVNSKAIKGYLKRHKAISACKAVHGYSLRSERIVKELAAEPKSATLARDLEALQKKREDLFKSALELVTSMEPVSAKRTPSADGSAVEETDAEKVSRFGLVKLADLPLPATIPDKELRTKFHAWIRSNAEGIVSVQDEGVLTLKPGNRSKRRSANQSWPKGRHPFLRFAMGKTNTDLPQALTKLGKFTKANAKMFGFAGTKDKRGVTSQWVTVKRKHAADFAAKAPLLAQRGIIVGNYSYVKHPLKTGDLRGNKFEIALRNISGAEDAAIAENVNRIAIRGFPNYFGMQRFGTGSVPTHVMGRALLAQDYQTLVYLLLGDVRHTEEVSPGANGPSHPGAYYLWSGGNAGEALKRVNSMRNHYTRKQFDKVLRVLHKDPKAFEEALNAGVPHHLKSMYLHAWQSEIFNRCASERLKMVKGSGFEDGAVFNVEDGSLEIPSAMEGDLVIDVDNWKYPDDPKDSSRFPAAAPVKTLTIKDVATGKYSLKDVILPIVGSKTQFPANAAGDMAKEALIAAGMEIKDLERNMSSVKLPGSYRRLIATPKDLTCSVNTYDDVALPLIASDADRIAGAAPIVIKTDGVHRAVVLTFTLDSSSYATMLLREATHSSSDPRAQALRNTTAASTAAVAEKEA